MMFGDQSVEGGLDWNPAGSAEAFPFSDTASGTVRAISIYVDSHSNAKTLIAGLYSDRKGHPGTLLASGTKTGVVKGAWNSVPVSSSAVNSGSTYWVTLLGRGGTLYFRDRSSSSCHSESSSQSSLTSLPSTWKTGSTWDTCRVAAFMSGIAAPSSVPPPPPPVPPSPLPPPPPSLLTPTNTAQPTVSGTTTQGQTLSTTNGSWTNLPTSFAYAWEDCDTAGNNCSAISGATSSGYALTAMDAGHTVRSVVTASNLLGSGTASSGPTATVIPLAPANTAAPAVSGTAKQGQALTTSNGSWSNNPTGFTYAWQDCDGSGGNCTAISGAKAASYTLAAGDAGHTIRAVVAANNAGGSGSATSAQTAVVTAPAPPSNTAPPTISGQTVQGQTVSATKGTWSGTPTSFAYQWRACDSSGNTCTNLSGASAPTYTLTSGDVGHTLRAVVTATNAAGSAAGTSAATGVVTAPAPPTAPSNTAPPTISGQTAQGQTLTTTNGTWSGNPTAFAYQWQDCNSSGASCTGIAGATSPSYTLKSSDVNDTIRSVVTATNAGGSGSATAGQTAVVTAPSTGGGGCALNATPSTFASQVSAASAGQTVCLASGNYGIWHGTNKVITIAPQQGATPTMGLAFATGASGFTINGGRATYTQTWGIQVNQTWNNGPAFDTGAQNITIKNTDFNVQTDVENLKNANILFDHNVWHDINGFTYDVALWLGYSAGVDSGVTVQNSLFRDMSSDGIQTGDQMRILNNEFVNVYPNAAGGNENIHTDAVQLYGATNTTIIGNFVHGHCEQGIGAFDGTASNTIEHNVVVGCTAHSMVLGGDTPGSTLEYNTIVGDPNGSLIECASKPGEGPSVTVITNNISQGGINESGSNRVNCTPSQDNHNMFSSGARSSDMNSTPVFVGGSSPSTFSGYALASGSPGSTGASDGGQIGAFDGGWTGGPPGK
jgi:Right handed beta helix region